LGCVPRSFNARTSTKPEPKKWQNSASSCPDRHTGGLFHSS
jgi:hypothetical protein